MPKASRHILGLGALLVILALFLGAAPSLTATPSPAPQRARTYKVATVSWAGWAPLHVAQDLGFWRRRGLSVRVINYDDPLIILEAVKAGRVDFAMDMAGSLVGVYQGGARVVALAETDWSHGGDKIVIKKGARLADLAGKPLGVFLKLPSCLFFLDQYLKSQNLKLSRFRVVEIGAEALAAQFKAGRIPAMVLYDPWASQAAAEGGGVVVADSSQYPGVIPECVWAYRSHLAGIPARDVVGFLSGWVEAAHWVNQPGNWPRYQDILNRETFRGHMPYSESQLKSMARQVAIHDPQTLWQRNRDGGGLADYFNRMRAFLAENHMLRKDYRAEDLFDNRYLLAALKEWGIPKEPR